MFSFYVRVCQFKPAGYPCNCVYSLQWGKDLWETFLSWEALEFFTLVSAEPRDGIKDPQSIPSFPTLLT